MAFDPRNPYGAPTLAPAHGAPTGFANLAPAQLAWELAARIRDHRAGEALLPVDLVDACQRALLNAGDQQIKAKAYDQLVGIVAALVKAVRS